MRRVIGFVVILAVLVLVSVWLAEQPGYFTLDWGGWRIETSVAVLAAALAVLAAVAALLYRVWLFTRRLPRRIGESRREVRRRRGYLALTRGMVAVAAGDAHEAHRQVKQAEGLLGDPPLTMLLSAQASQLAGDERAAEKFFNAMLNRPETEFLGVRGLLSQALKRGNKKKALELAQRGHRLRPNSDWVSAKLFDLQIEGGHWSDAEQTLKHSSRNGLVTQAKARRDAAALAVQRSREAAGRGEDGEALKLLRRAHDQEPGFAPASVALARRLVADGKAGRAASVIEKAWTLEPHPDLAEVYWEARRVEDALAKVRAAQNLAKLNPDHPESHLAVARSALEARLWGEARAHLEAIGGEDPPARVCRLMAELEESEHEDMAAARGWLMRASMAEPDPAWVCDSCGNAVADWTVRCGKCGSFNSFVWRAPPRVVYLTEAEEPKALPPGEGERNAEQV